MTAHEAVELVRADGRRVAIDTALVRLIAALWAAGFETIGSCQDLGESIGDANNRKAAYWKGWVLLEMPEHDACRLGDLAIASGRFPLHWAEDGAWEITMPLIQVPGAGILVTDLVQIRFPAGQLDDVTALVRAARGR